MSNNDSNNTGNNTSNSSRNSSSNRLNVPEARQAMDQFKMLLRQRGGREPQAGLQRRPHQP